MSVKNIAIGTGRRKTAIAVVKLVKGKGRVFVNGRTFSDYFGNRAALEMMVYRPLALTDNQEKFDVRVKTAGGGISAQAGAIKHGISRALLQANGEFRPTLKSAGFLTRDPRMKERKKYGLKKARRAPQFSKR